MCVVPAWQELTRFITALENLPAVAQERMLSAAVTGIWQKTSHFY